MDGFQFFGGRSVCLLAVRKATPGRLPTRSRRKMEGRQTHAPSGHPARSSFRSLPKMLCCRLTLRHVRMSSPRFLRVSEILSCFLLRVLVWRAFLCLGRLLFCGLPSKIFFRFFLQYKNQSGSSTCVYVIVLSLLRHLRARSGDVRACLDRGTQSGATCLISRRP